MLSPELIALVISMLTIFSAFARGVSVLNKLSSQAEEATAKLKRIEDALNKDAIELIELRHRVTENTIKLEDADDKLILSINGITEKLQHNATRFRGDIDSLQSQVTDISNYLAKNTDFNPRNRHG